MVNVTKTYLPELKKYEAYLEKIFKIGFVTNNGPLVKELENKLEKYLGVKHVLLVANGTIALQIAYNLLDIKGDAITTPFSFVATTSSQVWQGINPVFADINKDTFNIDYKKIKEKISKTTSAIIPVHVFGNACDVEKIDEIAKKFNLKVIYDASHAFGVKYKENSVLNYGDISTLSFHATKVFHTIEGGALVISDDEIYNKARKIINFGISDQEHITEVGINGKMNEFEAAMGLCVLDDIDKIFENRKKAYENYMNYLSKKLIRQEQNINSSLNYCYFPVVFKDEESLLKVKRVLENENIYPRRYFYPSLNDLPYIKNKAHSVPNSEYISIRILCLPLYDSLEPNVQKNIIGIINKIT
ncbi:DegT/DnrJ/EryC1/StrS family aminotransferase [Clostridium sp. 19966]|uniref:DegT/DnrJ/EryC1/StrS family aminotransferase n=1 Tax=Clostridium sp. 19966 TaxID=2768166 RepID=UPI0028DD9EE3|nr:DegT/DnrJ/EryC1/StrS family aminotransferase [Clostridium sp. 19966]MDT8717884.1 DegT/DnrJ/EryC1/StrS family aminotransferase [Clostridium sp. 19966]